MLFDHNVPRRLRHFLENHVVSTAREMGWTELENGMLLSAADFAGFEVLVTGDKNLAYQQNMAGRKLSVVVLETNNWNLLKVNPWPVVEAVDRAKPGSFQRVF